ncbi:unnamed protein product [Boreogadus saida]
MWAWESPRLELRGISPALLLAARLSQFTQCGRYSCPGDGPSVMVTSITLDRVEGEKVREEGLTEGNPGERMEAVTD